MLYGCPSTLSVYHRRTPAFWAHCHSGVWGQPLRCNTSAGSVTEGLIDLWWLDRLPAQFTQSHNSPLNLSRFQIVIKYQMNRVIKNMINKTYHTTKVVFLKNVQNIVSIGRIKICPDCWVVLLHCLKHCRNKQLQWDTFIYFITTSNNSNSVVYHLLNNYNVPGTI